MKPKSNTPKKAATDAAVYLTPLRGSEHMRNALLDICCALDLPASEADKAMGSEEALHAFAKTHGQSLDWIVNGDAAPMLRTLAKRNPVSDPTATTDAAIMTAARRLEPHLHRVFLAADVLRLVHDDADNGDVAADDRVSFAVGEVHRIVSEFEALYHATLWPKDYRPA